MGSSDQRPVALVLGSGPRLGYALMRHFVSKNYRVVGARRNLEDAEALEKEGILLVRCEMANAHEIDSLWPMIEEKMGQPPSVVIFEVCANVYGVSYPDEEYDTYSVKPEAFENDAVVNIFGLYRSIHHSVAGFKKLLEKERKENLPESPKCFFHIGNLLHWSPLPMATTVGPCKEVGYYMCRVGAMTYQDQNFRFYNVAQDYPVRDWAPAPLLEPHCRVIWDLVQQKEQGLFDIRFSLEGELVPEEKYSTMVSGLYPEMDDQGNIIRDGKILPRE